MMDTNSNDNTNGAPSVVEHNETMIDAKDNNQQFFSEGLNEKITAKNFL